MSSTTLTENLSARTMQKVGAKEMDVGLRATVVQALTSCHSDLRLGKNACLAILSAEDQRDHFLYPEEEQALSPHACAKKRTELTLGRAAVRRALRELGEASFPLLRGDHGEPVWREGITGSMTHCWPWTAALLVTAGKRFAVGIDLESLEQAAAVDIGGLICTPAELEWARGDDLHGCLAMIFSAKEAVYKAFYPFCRRYIDFKEVELSWLPPKQSFRVAFGSGLESELAALGACEVQSRRINGLVFSCLVHGLKKTTGHS